MFVWWCFFFLPKSSIITAEKYYVNKGNTYNLLQIRLVMIFFQFFLEESGWDDMYFFALLSQIVSCFNTPPNKKKKEKIEKGKKNPEKQIETRTENRIRYSGHYIKEEA